MSLPQAEQTAIIEWINSFELESVSCSAISDLQDGVVLLKVLHAISANNFPSGSLSAVPGNYVLAASNIRKLLKMIDAYYRKALHRSVDVSTVDSTSLSKGDEVQAKALVQLVVGCAALCEDRGTFVPRILNMDAKSQEVLKSMIEHVMIESTVIEESDTEDKDGDETDSHSNFQRDARVGSTDADEELFRARQMIEHLTNEKKQLAEVIATMEQTQETQNEEREELTRKVGQLQISLDEQKIALKNQTTVAQERLEQLQEVMQSLQSNSDSAGTIGDERDALQRELDASKLAEHQLRMDLSELRDRLELAEEGSKRQQESERKVQKYERKLEELETIQEHVRAMESKNSELLDQIVSLEAEKTELKRYHDQVRSLRDKNAQLERENMEVRSREQDMTAQLSVVQAELATEIEKRTFIEDQLETTKDELAQAQEAGTSSGAGGGLGLFESPGELKEKIARLEREVRVLREGGGGSQGGADAQMLREELEHERRLRSERDTQFLEATKKITVLEHERAQLAALADEQSRMAASANDNSVRRAESNVDRLEKRCVELETRTQELETEKAAITAQKQKIEAFVKRAMVDMQEKFKSVTARQQERLTEFRERIHFLEDRLKEDSERHRQERAMLASVLYEYGMTSLDKTFHGK